jgi:putative PIN family toxin of toxin-antitoxin system
VVSATLDTSVYIRALHLGGPAATLIGYARMGELRIDLSQPIMDETMRVLRERFGWSAEMAHFTREKLAGICNLVTPPETLNVIDYDPPDNRVLECAVEAKSDFIVSEDRDLLRLGEYGGAKILTVRDFIQLALAPGRER